MTCVLETGAEDRYCVGENFASPYMSPVINLAVCFLHSDKSYSWLLFSPQEQDTHNDQSHTLDERRKIRMRCLCLWI